MAVLRRLGLDVVDLLADLLGRVAVGEIPVGDARGHVARGARGAALEDLRLRVDRLRLQRVVVEAIEVAAEGEVVLRPDAAQRADELLRAAIALVVVEPGLADRRELAAEPAADDVDGDAAVGEMVDRRDLFGGDRRVPRPRQDRGDHLELGRSPPAAHG